MKQLETFILIIAITYVPFLFLARWLDYRYAWKHDVLFCRSYLNRGLWFMPIGNILLCIQVLFLIFIDYAERSNSKFLAWLIVSPKYKTPEEIQEQVNMSEAYKSFHGEPTTPKEDSNANEKFLKGF